MIRLPVKRCIFCSICIYLRVLPVALGYWNLKSIKFMSANSLNKGILLFKMSPIFLRGRENFRNSMFNVYISRVQYGGLMNEWHNWSIQYEPDDGIGTREWDEAQPNGPKEMIKWGILGGNKLDQAAPGWASILLCLGWDEAQGVVHSKVDLWSDEVLRTGLSWKSGTWADLWSD